MSSHRLSRSGEGRSWPPLQASSQAARWGGGQVVTCAVERTARGWRGFDCDGEAPVHRPSTNDLLQRPKSDFGAVQNDLNIISNKTRAKRMSRTNNFQGCANVVRTCGSQTGKEFECVGQMMLACKLDTQASTQIRVAVRVAEARKLFFNMRPTLVEQVPA